jgi:hypothetical protein
MSTDKTEEKIHIITAIILEHSSDNYCFGFVVVDAWFEQTANKTDKAEK